MIAVERAVSSLIHAGIRASVPSGWTAFGDPSYINMSRWGELPGAAKGWSARTASTRSVLTSDGLLVSSPHPRPVASEAPRPSSIRIGRTAH